MIVLVVVLFSFANVAFASNYAWKGNFALIQSGTSQQNYTRAAQTVCKYYLPVSISVDGAFGAGTTTAVKTFQTRANLTSDGIVGQNTWLYMNTTLSGYNDVPQKTNGDFKVYQSASGTYTNTTFFMRPANNIWSVYVAGPGTTPGTPYVMG